MNIFTLLNWKLVQTALRAGGKQSGVFSLWVLQF